MRAKLVTLALMVGLMPRPCKGEEQARPFLPVGVFLASIEEGGRIFTPVRLLPLEHPESLGHEFPNALQLRGAEFDTLVLLGGYAGLGLRATLQRYPQEPDSTWPYQDFAEPPIDALRKASVVRRPKPDAPLPGLRVTAFCGGRLAGFIVDTRGLSLADRKMERATTMGLDVSRTEFLKAVGKAAMAIPAAAEAGIVVYAER